MLETVLRWDPLWPSTVTTPCAINVESEMISSAFLVALGRPALHFSETIPDNLTTTTAANKISQRKRREEGARYNFGRNFRETLLQGQGGAVMETTTARRNGHRKEIRHCCREVERSRRANCCFPTSRRPRIKG